MLSADGMAHRGRSLLVRCSSRFARIPIDWHFWSTVQAGCCEASVNILITQDCRMLTTISCFDCSTCDEKTYHNATIEV